MENFGVIYVAFGAPYLAQALVSAISLRVTNPDVPVCIVTNVVREPPRLAWWSPEDHWIFLEKETADNRNAKRVVCSETMGWRWHELVHEDGAFKGITPYNENVDLGSGRHWTCATSTGDGWYHWRRLGASPFSSLIANPPAGAPVPPILPPVDGFLFLDKANFANIFGGCRCDDRFIHGRLASSVGVEALSGAHAVTLPRHGRASRATIWSQPRTTLFDPASRAAHDG